MVKASFGPHGPQDIGCRGTWAACELCTRGAGEAGSHVPGHSTLSLCEHLPLWLGFDSFLSVPCSPYIIGTMNQATSSTPNLQLHHNFR